MMNKRSAPAEGKSPRVVHQSGHVVRNYGFKESLGGSYNCLSVTGAWSI